MADENGNGNGATKANVSNLKDWVERIDEKITDNVEKLDDKITTIRELIATNQKAQLSLIIMVAISVFAPLQGQITLAADAIQDDICDLVHGITTDYTRRDLQLLQAMNELRAINDLEPLPMPPDLGVRPNC